MGFCCVEPINLLSFIIIPLCPAASRKFRKNQLTAFGGRFILRRFFDLSSVAVEGYIAVAVRINAAAKEEPKNAMEAIWLVK
jgi:hypothetical protein